MSERLEAADTAVSVTLTEAELAELIAGKPMSRFIEALPREGLFQDLEVIIVPPDPLNPTGS